MTEIVVNKYLQHVFFFFQPPWPATTTPSNLVQNQFLFSPHPPTSIRKKERRSVGFTGVHVTTYTSKPKINRISILSHSLSFSVGHQLLTGKHLCNVQGLTTKIGQGGGRNILSCAREKFSPTWAISPLPWAWFLPPVLSEMIPEQYGKIKSLLNFSGTFILMFWFFVHNPFGTDAQNCDWFDS